MKRIESEECGPCLQTFFYHGDTCNRNGVGLILREERTKDILEISRINDRIILLKLACPNTKEVTTIISAYAPQQGLPELEKTNFKSNWKQRPDKQRR